MGFSREDLPGNPQLWNYRTLLSIPQTVPIFLPCVVRLVPLHVAILSITNFPLVTVGRTLAGLFITFKATGGSRGNMSLTLPPLEILLLYEVRKTRPHVRLATERRWHIRNKDIISVLVLPSFKLQTPLPLVPGAKGRPCYLPIGPMALTREPSKTAGPPRLNTGSTY